MAEKTRGAAVQPAENEGQRRTDFERLIHGTVVRWEDHGGNIEHMLIDSLAPALAAERDRADRAEATLAEVRRYAEDRSIHHRARKDSVVGSWRIASDLLAILDSDGTK